MITVLHILPYIKDIAAPPRETVMFPKSYEFKTSVLKDVVLK